MAMDNQSPSVSMLSHMSPLHRGAIAVNAPIERVTRKHNDGFGQNSLHGDGDGAADWKSCDWTRRPDMASALRNCQLKSPVWAFLNLCVQYSQCAIRTHKLQAGAKIDRGNVERRLEKLWGGR
jgi:hypothetical protein